MKILAIETSCDETGIALVEGTKVSDGFTFTTLKAKLLSQAALHAEYGGVYPNLAKREHEKNLPILYREFAHSSDSGQADDECDAVAVTNGPGLEPALWQGVEFAKRVAKERGVPLLPVNHMEGHLLSSLVQNGELKDVQLPVLALLISGGHTEFVVMDEWFTYRVIGQTLDDAVGEAYDKVARMLGLSYPGGPEISKHATRSRARAGVSAIKLPRPMLQSGTCDVSFSGLKTAALYSLRGLELTDEQKEDFAAEFEEAVGDVFVAKTRMAIEETGAQTFVIGGGVAANTYLRERLQKLLADEFPNVELRLPELSITGDNAIMIAQCALARALSGKNDAADDTLRAIGNLSIASA
ncbi:MAG TPA: tRNA (adenosine(37)-N6)-threonylcarbamoyltransferase complex transferase subunit TsaD [Candidatus Paceibacterota bacterium]